MKIIFCLDKNNGIMFGNRRQSRDSVLISHIVDLYGEKNIFISEYSKPLFDSFRVNVTENIPYGTNNAVFFAENNDFDLQNENVTEIVVCRWNRLYPGDKFVTIPENFKKTKAENIVGSSHDKITLEYMGKKS